MNSLDQKNTILSFRVTGGQTAIMVIRNGQSAFYGCTTGDAGSWPNYNCLKGIESINTVTRRH